MNCILRDFKKMKRTPCFIWSFIWGPFCIGLTPILYLIGHSQLIAYCFFALFFIIIVGCLSYLLYIRCFQRTLDGMDSGERDLLEQEWYNRIQYLNQSFGHYSIHLTPTFLVVFKGTGWVIPLHTIEAACAGNTHHRPVRGQVLLPHKIRWLVIIANGKRYRFNAQLAKKDLLKLLKKYQPRIFPLSKQEMQKAFRFYRIYDWEC